MRILIIKLGSIGDVVHTLPAVAALRRTLRECRIDWVVEPGAAGILKDCPVIDGLIEIDSKAWRRRLLSAATLSDFRSCIGLVRGANGLRGGVHADVAIDFQGLIKSGIVALASGAKRRVGFETADLREKPSRMFLTEQVETTPFAHVIDKNLALARAVCPEIDPTDTAYDFPVSVSAEDEAYVNSAIARLGRGFAIINPGGGWPTKRWAAGRFGQVADWLWNEHGIASLVTYGPGEESLAQSVAASSRSGGATPFASTLKQFIALARHAQLFVGGDTGPLHLATACGTPVVGLYGPTAPERNGPFDPRDVTVGRDLWCRQDCHRRSCWHWECLDIPVTAVINAIEVRLSAGVSARRGKLKLEI